MVPMALGCGGADEEKPSTNADADDTGTPEPDYVHTFSVTANEPFERYETVALRGEENWAFCNECPEGLTVEFLSEIHDELVYFGVLAAGTYEFSVTLSHVWDGPTEYSTIEAKITAE